MHVTYAQLPPAADSDDRVFVTPHAVIVLDGASAFTPVPVSAATYADTLGHRLAEFLTERPRADLHAVLSEAIEHVATKLDLRPGESPSSTVSILRETGNTVDVLVLGDSPVIVGAPEPITVTDNRLARLDLPERNAYRARLAASAGFDDEHRALLARLQRHQAQYRNQPGGYWIAEADPAAAYHAVNHCFPRNAVNWAVVATDGAGVPLTYLGLADWPALIHAGAHALMDLLRRCHRWEANADPDACAHPRAKRHDDKTIVALKL